MAKDVADRKHDLILMTAIKEPKNKPKTLGLYAWRPGQHEAFSCGGNGSLYARLHSALGYQSPENCEKLCSFLLKVY